MNNTIAGLALGALLSVAPAVQADQTLEFDTFTISYIAGSGTGSWDMSLLGQTPLTTSISLDSLNRDLAFLPADDLTGVGATNGGSVQAAVRIDVRDGYRVTGISLHALADGIVAPGQAPDAEPGSADNFASVGFLLTAPGISQQFSWQREDFNGLVPVALGTGPLSLGGTFQLDIGANVFAQAWGSVGPETSSGSYALASIGNALLNVQVSAIPEPASYALLLGGLGVLGMAARRQGR